MIEIVATKFVFVIKSIVLIFLSLIKFIIAPFMIMFNYYSNNNQDLNSMTDFKFYIHKTWHTILTSLISIKGAFWLLILQYLAFISPLKSFFHIVIFLVVFDTITALFALYKQEGSFSAFYDKWTSKRAMNTVKKAIWYSLLGIMMFILGSGIGEAELMKKVSLGLVGYIEGKSCIENIDKILGTNIWELLSSFLKDKFLPKKEE